MESRIRYVISFNNFQLYEQGTYKLSYQILSNKSQLPFQAWEQVGVDQQATKHYTTSTPIKLTEETSQQTQVTKLTVLVDRSQYPDPAYLHVSVLKLNTDNGDVASGSKQQHEEQYENCCTGRSLLQYSPGGIFSMQRDENVEWTSNGTLNLYRVLQDGQVRVAAGWLKYSMSVSTLDDGSSRVAVVSAVDAHARQDQQSTLDLQDSINLPSKPPGKRLSVLVPGVQTAAVNFKALLGSQDAEKMNPTVTVPDKLHSPPPPQQQPQPQRQRQKHEDLVDSLVSVRTPEQPLSCSNVLVDLPDVNAIKQLLPKYHALKSQPPKSQAVPDVDPHVPIREPETRMSLHAVEGKNAHSDGSGGRGIYLSSYMMTWLKLIEIGFIGVGSKKLVLHK